MSVESRRLGLGVAVVGFLLLLSLRFWASPITRTITGREGVSVVSFLAIPLFLLVIGVGIVIFIWGDELGIG